MPDSAPSPRRSREATRQLWVERLARFVTAEQSVAAFCAAEGVSTNAFFYWKRRLAAPFAPDAQPSFVPIRVTTPAGVEVVLPGGAVLRIAPGCDLAFVRSLIDALAGAPC